MEYIRIIRASVGTEKIFLNFAGVWIANRNGVLLERRRWGLIGGAMALGESARDTARRECLEETGLEVEIGDLIGVYTNYHRTLENGDKYQAIVHCFYRSVDESKVPVASSESIEVRYFMKDYLPELGIDQHRDIAIDALVGRNGVAR